MNECCGHECVCGHADQVITNFKCPVDSGYWKNGCKNDTRNLPRPEKNPSKKRRDAWIWTTCKGCKFKKECNNLLPYMPPCGRDYDEELAIKRDQQIRAQVLEEVYKRLEKMTTPYHYEIVLPWSDIDCLFAELKGDVRK